MTAARLVAAVGALAMVAVIGYGLLDGEFFSEGRQLLSMPWGRVSLVDLYVGFALFACWVLFREGITTRSVVWIISVMALGSFAVCLYVLVALQASRKNWETFFLGRRSKESSSQ